MITLIAGRYQLVHEVGSGGMGRVFQAVDTQTGKTVAVKILLAGGEVDRHTLIRFMQEGALLSTLKHPNIVQVYGTHLEEQASSIIMEFLEGRTLGALVRQEQLSLSRIKHLARQTVSALSFAHLAGVIHRDVKPDNIMVIGDDHVKVTDFGIARLLQEGSTISTLTSTGGSMGTPLYMPPEQIEGLKVDGRSDIYSFGCVLYQMVTGRPPFEGRDPLTVAFQHVHKAPQPPGDFNVALPDAWEALILMCLAKDPDRRYQTALALKEALTRLEEDSTPTRQFRPRQADGAGNRSGAEMPVRDQQARTLLDAGKTKELAGDLRGAIRDYRAALTVVSSGPLRHNLEEAVRRVTARMVGAPGSSIALPRQMEPALLAQDAAPERTLAVPRPGGVRTQPESVLPEMASLGPSPERELQPIFSGATTAPDEATTTRPRTAISLQDKRLQLAAALASLLVLAVSVILVLRALHGNATIAGDGNGTAVWGSKGSGPGQFDFPTGLAVGTDGNIYVADTNNSRIEKISPAGRFLATWGSYGSEPGHFNKPSAVAIDGAGNIYVADSINNRLEKLSESGDLVASWGTIGSGPGQFEHPSSVAFDSSGNIYVADTGNSRIEKFSPSGHFLASWGSIGSGPGQFYHPLSVAVDAKNNVYVADTFNNRVEKFSASGHFLASLGSTGSGPGHFYHPLGVAVDTLGYLYVADTGNSRVEKFSPMGRYLTSRGRKGHGPQQFNFPTGAAADIGGTIYIADSGNNRIVRLPASWTPTGNGASIATPRMNGFMIWGSKGSGRGQFHGPDGVALDSSGNVYVADTNNNRVEKLSSSGQFLTSWGVKGSGRGQFDGPSDIAVDGRGNIYVADTNNCRVEKLSPSGRFLASWGSRGSGPGQFNQPYAVAVDKGGNIYVADSINDRIEKLSPVGRLIASWGTIGTQLGQFNFPTGIAVDATGNIYVSDTNNSRIEEFSPSGRLLISHGRKGSRPGQFNFPIGIAVDGRGNVYVADTNNSRIEKLSPSGRFLTSWGNKGSGPGQFNLPAGIAVDKDDTIYVADSNNNHIDKIAPH